MQVLLQFCYSLLQIDYFERPLVVLLGWVQRLEIFEDLLLLLYFLLQLLLLTQEGHFLLFVQRLLVFQDVILHENTLIPVIQHPSHSHVLILLDVLYLLVLYPGVLLPHLDVLSLQSAQLLLVGCPRSIDLGLEL